MIITDWISLSQALKNKKCNCIVSISQLHMYVTITCMTQGHCFFAGYKAISGYMAKSGLMFWPRPPCIRQSRFTMYFKLILPQHICVGYLDDILQVEWNINVTSKVFGVQLTIKQARFYPNGMQKR